MGIGGRALAFLKAAYPDLSCEVKVGQDAVTYLKCRVV